MNSKPLSHRRIKPPRTRLEVATGRLLATRFGKPHAPTGQTQASITACAHRISSCGPFNIHRCLTAGAASFKSLYLERPPGSQVTDASPRGRSRYSPKTYGYFKCKSKAENVRLLQCQNVAASFFGRSGGSTRDLNSLRVRFDSLHRKKWKAFRRLRLRRESYGELIEIDGREHARSSKSAAK